MDNFEDIQMITQPKNLRINLYPHQLASIYEMEKREFEKKLVYRDYVVETNIGLNCDKTGYGKTLSMVTLILRDKMKWDMNIPYIKSIVKSEAMGNIKKTCYIEYEKINTTLIMVNQSIVKQWMDEFSHTNLRVGKLTTRKLIETTDPRNYDVLIVIPTMYNRVILRHFNMAWKRFIYDEPGHIKVPGMREVAAGFYWLVTATPSSIMSLHHRSRTGFIFKLFGNVIYNFQRTYGYLIIKNSEQFIQQSFSMPVTQNIYHKCFQPIYNTLKGLVKSGISKLISAGDIQGAIKALGGSGTSNVTELIKQKKQEEIDEIDTKIRILRIRRIPEDKIRKWIDRKKRIKNQIKELEKRFENIITSDCNICLSPLDGPVMESKCQNVFCGKCLLKWLEKNKTCPLCRNKIDSKNLIYISSKETKQKEEKKEERLKTKANTILNLVKNEDRRFIIFSSRNSTFRPIRNILSQNKISFIEIKGSIKSREENLENFKNGETRVLFLNTKFNGTGINLQEATDVIVYHEMEKDILNQLLGRANRIGRKESLRVHHLII